MKSILAAVDLSDASAEVVAKAGELAVQLPARIVILHVAEPILMPLTGLTEVLAAAWPLQTKHLEQRLDSLAQPLRASGVKWESVALVGLAVDDILEQSVYYHAEFIVLGCHGHLATRHPFTGNVISAIVSRQPPCPVIVVPVKSNRLGN